MCVVGLYNCTKHLLRRLAGRKVLGEFREVVLAVLDPTGRARSDHGESSVVLDSADELVCFFNDGQVSGEVHIVYAIKAESLESCNHLAFNVGAGLVAEAFAKLCTNRRSGANNSVLGGICKSCKYTIGIVSFIESAHGTSYDTLTAVDAGGSCQRLLKSRTDIGIKSTVVSADNANFLYLCAGCYATTAKNTLVVIANNGGLVINLILVGFTFETGAINTVFTAESLQLAVGGTNTRETLLIVVGEQQLKIHLARCSDLGGVGLNFHTFSAGVNTSGYHSPRAKCGTAHFSDLNQAETASTDFVDVFEVAQCGNVDVCCLCGFQNRGTLGYGIFLAINFYFDHIHFPQFSFH